MPESYYQENRIPLVHMTFVLSGQTYDSMEVGAFYNKLRGGEMPTTNQANLADHLALFEPILQEGQDILHISFSSALSGTYNSAVLAAKELEEKYPERKILVIDSKCASMGEGLYLWYAVKNRADGMSLEENAAWMEKEKLSFAHWFTVDDLQHLYRGGRVSKTTAFMGTVLGIKPVLHVDDEGRLIPMEKVRGRKKSIEQLFEHLKNSIIEPEGQTIFISHGDCEDEAKGLAEMIRKALPVGEIVINPIGPIIGTHSGAGTVALFFRANKR